MARIGSCATCATQTLNADYCSEECAVAPLSDLLARIQEHLHHWKSLDDPEGQELLKEVLEGRWAKLSDFLKQLEERRFQEGQAAAQERLDDLLEFDVAQKAVEKFRKGKGKKSRIRC